MRLLLRPFVLRPPLAQKILQLGDKLWTWGRRAFLHILRFQLLHVLSRLGILRQCLIHLGDERLLLQLQWMRGDRDAEGSLEPTQKSKTDLRIRRRGNVVRDVPPQADRWTTGEAPGVV